MLSIIVPVKNNLRLVRSLVDSIRNYTEDYELIIVNDGSDDKTTTYLKQIDNSIYIENEKSLGYPKACNQGLKEAKGDYIVVANSDTVATHNWAEDMIKHFERDKGLGVLGPTTNKVEGYQSIDFNKKGIDFQYTDVVTFFFVMIKREAFKDIGLFDERFGQGGQEDADYCIRARKAGWKVGIARDTFIYHYGSATFRNELDHNIKTSKDYANSRVNLLRNKYKDQYDSGIRKRIFVAIPSSTGKLVTDLVYVLLSWVRNPSWIIQLYMVKGMFPLDNARNHCVQKFLESNCDYLLWIDDDIVPPPDGLSKLLKADKDMIGGVGFAMKYENGVGFPYPVTLRYNEDKKYVVHYGQ